MRAPPPPLSLSLSVSIYLFISLRIVGSFEKMKYHLRDCFFFFRLNRQYMKGGGPTEKLVYMVDETSCILPRGVLFLKGTKGIFSSILFKN